MSDVALEVQMQSRSSTASEAQSRASFPQVGPQYRLEVMDFRDAARDLGVRATWGRLYDACDHPSAFQASPAWIEYKADRWNSAKVGVVRGQDGEVLGVVPIVLHAFALEIRSRFLVANVSGSLPLVPDGESLIREITASVFDALPECDAIHFDSLPIDSAWWDLGKRSNDGVLGYHHSGTELGHLVDVAGSFEEYALGLSPKLRSTARRGIRTLQQKGHGTLELTRCRSPEDVERLFSDAQYIRGRSWQHAAIGDLNEDDSQTSRKSLLELARRGLLRSYVLRAGDAPCAFVIGYQDRGVFFYAVVGFDPAFSRHSPGTVFLYLLLEDLFTVDRPRLVSFGRGDDPYKRRFGTRQQEVGGCLLFRPTLRNWARIQNHRLYAGMTAFLRPSV